MALMKRSVILVSALAALSACAPAGYDANNAGGTEPVANEAAAEPSTDPTVDPGTDPSPEADPSAASDVPDVELTEKLIGKKVDRMGQVVVDEEGWVLYRFDKDSINPPTSNCNGDCAKVWPPAFTDGDPQVEGIVEDKVGTVTRQDGTKQLTIGGWPVYRYIGDKKPGQWKGQGVGGTWFVVQPDGKKNLSCLPTGTPKPVAPPADGAGGAGDSGGGYSY